MSKETFRLAMDALQFGMIFAIWVNVIFGKAPLMLKKLIERLIKFIEKGEKVKPWW